jgi:hypothetical protein
MASNAVRSPIRTHWPALLAILALGAILRLIALDHPAIWGDEAMTYGRVCGTYRQMIAAMDHWAFVPLHYSLIWLIGQFRPLTPAVMRAAPAIAGILTVPALYWLGRELAGRSAGLMLALLAATSAYLLNYSRDAKMYSEFWLCCTLNIAALFWWLRVRNLASWWTWVATAVAMVGLQTQGLILLAVELLVVLTAPRANWSSLPRLLLLILFLPIDGLIWLARWPVHFIQRKRNRPTPAWLGGRNNAHRLVRHVMDRFAWPPIVLFALGIGVILPGPLCYYAFANHYAENVGENGWMRTGLQWVREYNDGRPAIEMPTYALTAYLTGWELPKPSEMSQIDVRTRRLLCGSCLAIAALLALGLFPWRSRQRWTTAADGVTIPLRWRPLLWIVLWIVLPAYACFIVSLPYKVTPAQAQCRPRDWIMPAIVAARGHWWWIAPAIFAVALAIAFWSASGWRKALSGLARIIAVAATIVLLCELLAAARLPLDRWAHQHIGSAWDEHTSVWMPRYFAISLPAVLLAAVLLIRRLPTRALRIAAVALIVTVNIAQHAARVWAGSEPPTELIAADMLAAQGPTTTTRTFTHLEPRRVNFGAPGSGIPHSTPMAYYLNILSGRTSTPNGFVWQLDNGFEHWPPSWWPEITQYVVRNIQLTPRLKRIVVWDEPPVDQLQPADRLADQLSPAWRRVADATFTVRDHWTWRNLYLCRRRVYERDPNAPPEPAPIPARPATAPAPRTRFPTRRPATTAPTTRPATRQSIPQPPPTTRAIIHTSTQPAIAHATAPPTTRPATAPSR